MSAIERVLRLALFPVRAVLEAVAPAPEPAPPPDYEATPRELMAELLERSIKQDTASSRREVHMAILRQLVPDEARIIAADPDDQSGYELLMAGKEVRAAPKEGELGKLPARIVRRTLVLSPRGRALWEQARP